MDTQHQPAHFKGKDAIGHVAEAQAEGLIDSTEVHGTEMPGHLSAATDTIKETAVLFFMLWLVVPFTPFMLFTIFGFSWLFWRAGRSGWLGWSRLERLHRVLGQEKWEIDHNRQQEKDELRVLYQAKGFEGKLLEDVLDVLMADGDRLLRVMVEEELGLSLQTFEHPLKQCLGAAAGVITVWLFSLAGLLLLPKYGMLITTPLLIGIAGGIAAQQSQNRITNAIIWNLGIAAITLGTFYFLMEFLL